MNPRSAAITLVHSPARSTQPPEANQDEVRLAAPMVISQGRANVVLEQLGSDELL